MCNKANKPDRSTLIYSFTPIHKFVCLPRLHLFIKYTAKRITIQNKCFLSFSILKCNLVMWRQSWIFSSHVITGSFRNPSNMLILNSQNMPNYWKLLKMYVKTATHFIFIFILCFFNIINVLTVAFDQCNVPLLNKSIHLLKKKNLLTQNFWMVVYISI